MRTYLIAMMMVLATGCVTHPGIVDYSNFAQSVIIGRGYHGTCYIQIIGKDGYRYKVDNLRSMIRDAYPEEKTTIDICDAAEVWQNQQITNTNTK